MKPNKPKWIAAISPGRATHNRHRVQRLVRRLRACAGELDRMCAYAERSKSFEYAGLGGTYLSDAANSVHCAINDLTPLPTKP